MRPAVAAALPPAARRTPRARSVVLLSILAAFLWAGWRLGLDPAELVPNEGGRRLATEFFSRALDPASTYESEVPPGTAPLLVKALAAARTTVVFAAAGLSLALVGGIVLGFFSSTAWWSRTGPAASSTAAGSAARWGRRVGPAVYAAARVTIAFLRSIHELLWAVLFLAAFGLGHLTAVFAIALPYAGTLAKVFSEMIDEAPREGSHALAWAGASPLQVFCFGLVPRALPDLAAYAFYRFECALRSSAVLGFFGFPTLGYYIAASFENLHYGEVWTYLWVLFGLVVVADVWSGALRRRFVA